MGTNSELLNMFAKQADFSLTRMQDAIAKMRWSKPESHPVNGKRLLLKRAAIIPEFWEAYRGFGQEWFSMGLSVSKRGKVYYVKWWSDDAGKFELKP